MNETPGIQLSFTKLTDGTCNVFADVSPHRIGDLYLVAERVHFIVTKPFAQDDDRHTLFNVPYEMLKEFAESILKEKINVNTKTTQTN